MRRPNWTQKSFDKEIDSQYLALCKPTQSYNSSEKDDPWYCIDSKSAIPEDLYLCVCLHWAVNFRSLGQREQRAYRILLGAGLQLCIARFLATKWKFPERWEKLHGEAKSFWWYFNHLKYVCLSTSNYCLRCRRTTSLRQKMTRCRPKRKLLEAGLEGRWTQKKIQRRQWIFFKWRLPTDRDKWIV